MEGRHTGRQKRGSQKMQSRQKMLSMAKTGKIYFQCPKLEKDASMAKTSQSCFQWPKLENNASKAKTGQSRFQWPKLAKDAFNGHNWQKLHQLPKLANDTGQNWQKMLSMAKTSKKIISVAKTGKRFFESNKQLNSRGCCLRWRKSIYRKTQLMHCISMLSLVQNQAGSGERPTLESAQWQRRQTGASAS